MQSLDVISVNLWQILISLANLVILFLILRHSMVTSFPFAVSMSGAAGNIPCFLHTKF